jgi:hypothetical protein
MKEKVKISIDDTSIDPFARAMAVEVHQAVHDTSAHFDQNRLGKEIW